MTNPNPRRGFDWEAAGRELGASLDGYCALVVIGMDPVQTGRVAVGIARAQAAKRRVAVGDLFAESPPIQELVHSDDPHGLVDSFLYGVSLSKIAHQVPDAGELYAMPSGTEPPEYEEILPNPRWPRLTAGFREVGALLVLAAPATAPKIETLVAATDGAILVGDVVPRKLPVVAVVSSVRDTKPDAEGTPATPTEIVGLPAPPPAWSRRRVAAIAGVVLTLVLVGVAAWLAYRPLAGPGNVHPRKGATPQRMNQIIAPDSVTRDTGARASGAASLAAVAAATAEPPVPRVVNPADSATTAAFCVLLVADNTQAGAILHLQQDGKALPAATFSPVLIQGTPWFKVISGAYPNRADADSLLLRLGRQGKLLGGSGSVVRLPFAFLIDSGVKAAAVPAMIAEHVERGQPIYGLLQSDGTAWLLAGAFASPEESVLYAQSLRASGITPVLVYRKGRVF